MSHEMTCGKFETLPDAEILAYVDQVTGCSRPRPPTCR